MFEQGIVFGATIGIFTQIVFDVVSFCVVCTMCDCCEALVLMQGIVCEALGFAQGVVLEALVLL